MDKTSRVRGRIHRAAVGGAVTLALLPVGTASAQVPSPPSPQPIDVLCADLPAEYQPFGDVRSEEFRATIRCQAAAAITQGVGPYTYAPGRPVTRAQMASFVARLIDAAIEYEDPDGPPLERLPRYDGSNAFTDVDAEDEHFENINRLATAGITQGGPGGLPASSYAPGLPVTREQMATYVVRALDHLQRTDRTADTDYFTDDDTSTHEANINVAASVGIAVGVGEGRFEPGAVLSREQMSAFTVRSLATLVSDGLITPIRAGEPVDYVPCENADGFTISYPETWFADESCTYFHPQPFEVPVGTDVNFAAVTAKRLANRPIDPDVEVVEERVIERTTVTIDGRPGIREESESTGEGLWPEGIRTLAYSVDLGDEYFGAYTIGTMWMDYGNNKTVLDRMAPTVDIAG